MGQSKAAPAAWQAGVCGLVIERIHVRWAILSLLGCLAFFFSASLMMGIADGWGMLLQLYWGDCII